MYTITKNISNKIDEVGYGRRSNNSNFVVSFINKLFTKKIEKNINKDLHCIK